MEEKEEFLPQPERESILKGSPFYATPYQKKGLSNWSQFGLLLGLLGVGLIVGSIISLVVVKLMIPHAHLLDLDKAILQPENANAMKIIQVLSTLFMFFIPAYAFTTIVFKKPFQHLGFNINISWQQLALVVLIVGAALFVGGGLGDLNEKIPIPHDWRAKFQKAEDEYQDQVVAIATMRNIKEYLMGLFIIALMPAIVEETFFRGTLQQFFVRWFGNPWVGILVTSILFSAIHWSYFGFLTRAMLGVVLGLLFYYGKSIWLNILAHFLNNAVAVTALYMGAMKGKLAKDALEDHYPLWLSAAATVILVYLFIYFKTISDAVLTKKESSLLPDKID